MSDEVNAPERIWIDCNGLATPDEAEGVSAAYIRADLARPSVDASAAALWDELYDYLTHNDDLNPWRREFYEKDAVAIITKHIKPSPSLADAIKEVERYRERFVEIQDEYYQQYKSSFINGKVNACDELLTQLRDAQPEPQPSVNQCVEAVKRLRDEYRKLSLGPPLNAQGKPPHEMSGGRLRVRRRIRPASFCGGNTGAHHHVLDTSTTGNGGRTFARATMPTFTRQPTGNHSLLPQRNHQQSSSVFIGSIAAILVVELAMQSSVFV